MRGFLRIKTKNPLFFYKFTIVYLTKYGGRDKNGRKGNFYWARIEFNDWL